MINIEESTYNEIINILQKNLTPEVDVYAFGSRVKGTARPYSDLDIVLIAKEATPLLLLERLKYDFEESDIPFRVDISDWHRISDSFKHCIEDELVPISF